MAFGFNLRNSLLGPAPQAHNVPQNNVGLRTPQGAAFNLGGFDPGPAPQVNLGDQGQQGNISYKFKRTASSDPIANLMRDLQNPLGGLQVNVGQSQPAAQMPQGFAAMPQAQPQGRLPFGPFQPFNPAFSQHTPSAWIPQGPDNMGLLQFL